MTEKGVAQSGKMWSGRFREPRGRDFEAWQRWLPFDWRLISFEVSASIAHARMITAAGILTPDEEVRMIAGLRAVGRPALRNGLDVNDGTLTTAGSTAQAEDVHHFVELELTREVGDLALKLHTGRSRNEQIATDMRLYVRDRIDLACDGQQRWATALVELARTAGEAVMPSFTHLQRAEPVLIAHWRKRYLASQGLS